MRAIYRKIPLLAALFSLLLVTVASADYTGPDRTVTEQVRDPENDWWTLEHVDPEDDFPDTCTIQQACEQPPGEGLQIETCGWVADTLSCEPAYREEEVSLPPARVTGALQCDQPGENGWCRDGLRLELSATEPLEGHAIQWLEGDTGVLCDPPDSASIHCTWSGTGEGQTELAFWAVSSYGDTSERGWVTWKLDGTPPDPKLKVERGRLGESGWYLSGPLTVTPAGEDAHAGFAGGGVRLGESEWLASLRIERDGVYEIGVFALDHAGNRAEAVRSLRLDRTPPALSTEIEGAGGQLGWYTSSVWARAGGSDETSGLDQVWIEVDDARGGEEVWIESEGRHTLRFVATDRAGNRASEAFGDLLIDKTPPRLRYELHGQEGEAGWWRTPVEVQAIAHDSTSGLAWVRYQVNEDAPRQAVAVSLNDGVHNVRITAADVAGLQSEQRFSLAVDTTPPEVHFSRQGGVPGGGAWYREGPVEVIAEVEDPVSGVASVLHRVGEGAWLDGREAVFREPGLHQMQVLARDRAGNETVREVQVGIDPEPPHLSIHNPSGGDRLWAAAVFRLQGEGADGLSGLASLELTLDGGEQWHPVEEAAGQWIYWWNTTSLPQAETTLILRGEDQAGNPAITGPLKAVVDNLPPAITLQDRWRVGSAPSLEVEEGGIGVARMEVVVHGGELGAEVYAYGHSELPDRLEWAGAIGGRPAPPGTYLVVVRAWDWLGNLGTHTSMVEVPGSGRERLRGEGHRVEAGEPDAEAEAVPTPVSIYREFRSNASPVPSAPRGGQAPQAGLPQPSDPVLAGMLLAYLGLFLGFLLVTRRWDAPR
jgi:hypothetical protein